MDIGQDERVVGWLDSQTICGPSREHAHQWAHMYSTSAREKHTLVLLGNALSVDGVVP